MNSLIAKKIRNKFVFLVSLSIYRTHNFVRHYLQLNAAVTICLYIYAYYTTIRCSSYTSARVSTNNSSVELYNGDLQKNTTVFLTHRLTQG